MTSPRPLRAELHEETLDSSLAFEGTFLRLFLDRVRSSDGHVSTREYIRHPGAVMIVPLLDADTLVLERQYRYPLGRAIVEFPAGKLDPGEDALACAERELLEETGYRAGRWSYLGSLHNAVAYSDERIDLFLAEGLRHEGARLDPGELLEVFTLPLSELLGKVRDGEVTDVKTMVGAMWVERVLAGQWSRRPATDCPPR